MASFFSYPRPAPDDPFLTSAVARKPLAIHTPSLSHSASSSHQDKARASSIFASTSPIAIPAAVKSSPVVGAGPPSPFVGGPASMAKGLVTPQGSYVDMPATPSSPIHPSMDAVMSDAFATPPMTRVLKPTRTSNLSHSDDGIAHSIRVPSSSRLPSKKSTPRPPAVKTTHLACPSAPLTPPLTPPSQPYLPAPLPFAALSSPIHLPTPVLTPEPTTISGRLLANYPLHPSFAQQYSIQEELGSGGFGFVVRAERNVDGLSVAVKFIERAKIPAYGWVKSRHWGDAPGLFPMVDGYRIVPMEAFVLRSVRHEGVVAYIDLFEDEKYFYLVRRLLLRTLFAQR